MSTAEDDLRNFSAFVRDRISKGEADDLGLAELFDVWKNPTDSQSTTNVAAINASIRDFLNGERGTPAGEHSRQLRQK